MPISDLSVKKYIDEERAKNWRGEIRGGRRV